MAVFCGLASDTQSDAWGDKALRLGDWQTLRGATLGAS